MSLEGWKSLFEIGGVVLLALTFVFGAGALIVNNRLNSIQTKELGDFKLNFEKEQQKTAVAQKEAAEAKATAESFRLSVAQADERAAEANLALAKFKQPRTLTLEQQDRIVSKIKAFPNQPFAVYGADDQESIDLTNILGHVLARATWNVQQPDSDIVVGKIGMLVATGVRAEIAPSRVPELSGAAEAFASALSVEGIPCKVVAEPFREKNPRIIHIVIGKKPI